MTGSTATRHYSHVPLRLRLHDTGGDIYTESIGANVGAVNGTIYTCTNSTTGPTSAAPDAVKCAVATQARLDAQAAYLQLAGLPPGANPGANLAALTLAPGVYTSPSGSFLIEGGDLTLDAQGDANAVFVFQMAQTLTVGGPGVAAPQSIVCGGHSPRTCSGRLAFSRRSTPRAAEPLLGRSRPGGSSFSTVVNVDLVRLTVRRSRRCLVTMSHIAMCRLLEPTRTYSIKRT